MGEHVVDTHICRDICHQSTPVVGWSLLVDYGDESVDDRHDLTGTQHDALVAHAGASTWPVTAAAHLSGWSSYSTTVQEAIEAAYEDYEAL